MIINTEDEGELDYYDDGYSDEDNEHHVVPYKYLQQEGRILEDSKEDEEDGCDDEEEDDAELDNDAATLAALQYY
jgi:hypothetical protein